METSPVPWRAVLRFWFTEAQDRWFAKDPGFDGIVRARFLGLIRAAEAGELEAWPAEGPHAALAYVLVCDQFPRNLFRASARAYACDARALRAARRAAGRRGDQTLSPLERAFLYMPYQHAEELGPQHIGLQLYRGLQPYPETESFYRSSVRHLDVIAKFGRFPHRNAILRRASTAAELAFLETRGARF